MNVLLLCALGQIVSFGDMQGFAEVTGSPEQEVAFYETWREYASSEWRKLSKNPSPSLWDREYAHVLVASKGGRLLYASDSRTRRALFKTIISRGYTVRFRVAVSPFGKFWVYYNSLAHALITIVFFLWFICHLTRRRSRHRKESRSNIVGM